MQSLSQRAQPRVKYPADVRLIAPSLRREVAGKSLNVSTSGIFVEAKELVEIGTDLWCDLPLPGGTRRLAGKVARLQPLPFSSERVGLGIRFVDLDEIARTLISNLVAREGTDGHLTEATFQGMEGAIRSQAVLTRDGARLSAALTFLRPGAEVKIAFLSGPSKVASRGVVRESAIEGRTLDGAPRLTVEVELVRQPSIIIEEEDPEEVTAVDTPRALQAKNMVAEATRAARTSTAPAAVASAVAAPRSLDRSGRRHLEHRGRPRHAPAATVSGEEVTPVDLAPAELPLTTRPLIKVGLAVTAALACFALGGISARLWPRPGSEPVSAERLVSSLPVPPAPAAAPVVPAPPAAPPTAPPVAAPTAVAEGAPPVPSASAGAATAAAAGAASAAAPPPPAPAEAAPEEDSYPAVRRPPRPTPAVTRLATSGPAPARARLRRLSDNEATSYTELALREAVPVAPGTPGPALLREGEELVAAVPFDGSAEGWRYYRLSEPRAVAVNLPHGRPVLALGRHAFSNEGFRGVWIREHEQGGIQIRFTLAYRTPEVLGVEVKDGTLRVRVAPSRATRSSPRPAP